MASEDKQGKRQRGVTASSEEFARYDQVDKPAYHLAEAADTAANEEARSSGSVKCRGRMLCDCE